MDRDGAQFQNVLIDEVQDLNELEMDVALTLVGDKIFAVGDPYQSIYGFQGALGPRVIDLLERVGCNKVELHSNYRSCQGVVSRLNKVFNRHLVSRNVKDTGLTFILCRTNDDVFYVSKNLKDTGIPHRVRLSKEYADSREYDVLGESSLRVNTIHQSKGQEADRVILFDWYPNETGEEERTYYVAMARASKEFIEVNSINQLLEVLNGKGVILG